MPMNRGRRSINKSSGIVIMHHIRKVVLLVCLVMQVSAFAQDGTVRSKLSASTITRDESVTLEITAIGMDAELDLSSLREDFEVMQRSSSREIRSIMEAGNGLRTTSVVTWALELIPLEVGIFTVPPVRVGNVSSQAHTLTVNELPTGASRDIFVEAIVDTQTPWVQSQVLMTLKVFQAIEIVDGGLDVPEAENLVVERLGDDVRTNEIREGRQYSVTTRRFALFPQKSGELILEPITLSVSVPADSSRVRGFFSPTRKLTRRTDPIVLDVKPRPNGDSAWWLPAKAVQLDSQWIGDVSTATVDQPLTRTIVLRASGVTDSQLPEINIPAIQGASLYAEEPERKLGANELGVLSELTINWAVIPQQAGEIELPAVSVDWFNTSTGNVETARLPAEKITVVAAVTSSVGRADEEIIAEVKPLVSDSIASESQGITAPELISGDLVRVPDNSVEASTRYQLQALESSVATWRSWALIVLMLWLSTMFIWWVRYLRVRSQTVAGSSRGRLGAVKHAAADTLSRIQPLGSVAASCKAGNPSDIRHALLEWAARQWVDNPPLTLGGLAKRLPAGDARQSVELLDVVLYSPRNDEQERVSILNRLCELPQQLSAAIDQSELQGTGVTDSVRPISTNSLPEL